MSPESDSEAFYLYLGEQLHLGPSSRTPEEHLEIWRKRREYEATVAAVREGVADMEAGRTTPLRALLNPLNDRSESGA
jgi:hypothetical protein